MNALKAVAAIMLCVLPFAAFPQSDQDKLDSPLGMYIVSEKGIANPKAISKIIEDPYDAKRVAFTTINDSRFFKSGEISAVALWDAETQQFNSTLLIKVSGLPRCNQWSEYSWSYVFEKATITLGAQSIEIWKEVDKTVAGRTIAKQCRNIRIYDDTCEFSCKSTPQTPKPQSYIVQSYQDARALLNALD